MPSRTYELFAEAMARLAAGHAARGEDDVA